VIRRRLPFVAAGLGLLACAACWAVPLLGALGFAGLAAGGLLEPVAGVSLALAALAAAVWSVRRRRARCAANASCDADGGCGCRGG
jgi:hypothetical protein